MSTPAGWYADPSGDPGWLRWWDGGTWTEHVQAASPVPSAPASPLPPASPVPPPASPMAFTGGGPEPSPPTRRTGRTGRIVPIVAAVAAVVVVGIAGLVWVAASLGDDQVAIDGTPLAVPGTPYEVITPEGWHQETDRHQLAFGEVAVLYEPVPQGEVGAAILIHLGGDPELLVPPTSDDPERVAVSNAHDFLAFFFPDSVEFMSSQPVDEVETITSEPVVIAGAEGFRVTMVHDQAGVMVDALALGGEDPLLIVGAGSGLSLEPGLREAIPEVVGSVRRQ